MYATVNMGCGVTVYIRYMSKKGSLLSKSGLDLASEHCFPYQINIIGGRMSNPLLPGNSNPCTGIHAPQWDATKIVLVGNRGKSSLHEGVNLKTKFELSS